MNNRGRNSADVVTPDHYATLQVSRSSEEMIIRAAYLALMRRYHPDNNPSADAAQRSRAINDAYAVLSDRHKRAEYDLMRSRQMWVVPPQPSPRRHLWAVAAAAAIVLIVAIPLLIDWRPVPAGSEPDQLVRREARPAAVAKPNPSAACASRAVYDSIKHDLFRQAAQVRGSDSAVFDRLANYSLLRVDTPTLSDGGCAASVALDLPPGVMVAGGRRSLAGQIAYTLPQDGAASAPGLSDGGEIVSLLATLERTPPPAAVQPSIAQVAPSGPVGPASVAIHTGSVPPPIVTFPQQPPRQIAAAVVARPASPPKPVMIKPVVARRKGGFGCRFTNQPGDVESCGNSNLATLDQRLMSLYSQSWRSADADKRALLQRTRDRFLARRNACRTDACVSQAYLGRMREISDIMAGYFTS